MDTLADDLALLAKQPSADVLAGLLDRLARASPKTDAERLNLANTVILQTVDNGVVGMLSDDSRECLHQILTSRTGLTALLSRLRSVDQLPSRLLTYTDLVYEIVTRRVAQLVESTHSELETKYLRSILVGSKLYGKLNEVYVALKETSLDSQDSTKLERLETLTREYVGIVAPQIMNHTDYVMEFMRFAAGNQRTTDLLFDAIVASEETYRHTASQLGKHKDAFVKGLVGYLIRRYGLEFVSVTDPEPLYEVAQLLALAKVYNWPIVIEHVMKAYPQATDMLKVIALLASNDGQQHDVYSVCIEWWSDKFYIASTPLPAQIALTRFLIILVSYLESVQDLSTDSRLLQGVTNHMESNSEKIRFVGMALPDIVHSRTGKKSIFNIEGYSAARDAFVESLKPALSLQALQNTQLRWPLGGSSKKTLAKPMELITDTQPKTLKITTMPSEQELFDPEDSDDEDPTVSRKNLPPVPVYLRELLTYIESDNYDKVSIALRIAPTLIRQKAKLGTEVSHYAEALLTALVGLRNNFSIDNFTNMVMNSVVAVVVCDFDNDASLFLLKLLVGGDYSLQQRMMIFSCLSISIRELRGYEDEIVSYQKTEFASKMLPPKIHEQFMNYGQKLSLEREAPSAIESEAITQGIITKISSKLAHKETSVMKPKVSSFYRFVGPKAFFPLTNIWHAVGGQGFEIGSYSGTLTAHYLKTLAIILECAYPTCVEIPDMVRELMDIYMGVLKAYTGDIQTLESVLIGLAVVLDGTDSRSLAEVFPQLTALNEWLQTQFENGLQEELLMGKLARIIVSLQETTDNLRQVYFFGQS